MNIKAFWEWLTTSRAYRLLQRQTQEQSDEIVQLREENRRLLMALSPAVRQAYQGTVQPLIAQPEPATEAAQESPRPQQPRLHVSWRAARARLEHQSNSKHNRQARAVQIQDAIPLVDPHLTAS